MDSDRNQMRRRSMIGTVLFALGIVALVASVVFGSLWLGGVGLVTVVLGAVMLYQVGKSLP
jgi:1,4-dihydroxy-2-naphthoate octaprenyltransferase